MKTMNKTLAWILAAALSFALTATTNAQESQARTGKIVRIKGDARYSTGNKVWQPLKVGTVIKSGHIVQTALNSFVDIVVNEEETATPFILNPMASASAPSPASAGGGASAVPSPDQDVIRVLDDSYLVFDSLSAVATGADTVTETLLDLKKGSIFGSVKKQAAASRFEIKTPNGVAGIRGTIFLVSALGKVSCLTGSVIAAYTDPSGNVGTQVVGAGQEFNTVTREGGAIGGAVLGNLSSMAMDCNYSSPNDRGRGRGRGHGKGHDHSHDHVSKHKP